MTLKYLRGDLEDLDFGTVAVRDEGALDAMRVAFDVDQ